MILEVFWPIQAKSYLGKQSSFQDSLLGAFLRQASEQYLMDAQFFSQDLRQVISFLQTTQILLGK